MNWGKWIVVSFVLFAAFIATLVTVCVREDVDLVSKDYYQDELAYQQQIDRMQNAADLTNKPEIFVDQSGLQIQYDQLAKIENAKLMLFCPANPDHDRKFIIQASSQEKQYVPVSTVESGMYRAKFSWSIDGKEFYVEQIINL